MNPWIPRALDLAVALVAGAGLVLILAAALAVHYPHRSPAGGCAGGRLPPPTGGDDL